ncbi:Protein phosphatase PP2A regulatory subunit B [Spiromyces aspiralis]|uniref:Protein phosphatase PP2A regulatory subunit B n=1 Tax=Spiromyces aspiralis TaxID=68401 RepID=A0ACC1HQ35_9FUNG|nr:Protein phosphatase PP2A regulatory subunit B [Spiromyces aspiralis]
MPNAFIPPGAAGYAIPPGYPPAPGQFPHPSMPRPMEWAINGQPGAIPPYPAAPSIHPQYQNTARPMAPRPPRSRNPNQRGGARGGGPRGISARGGHYPRNPRSVNQQFAAGAPASDDAAAAAAAAASAQSEEEPVKLTAASLAAASEENQKQMLGEALYPKIQQLADEDSVAKITGMLLEMDNSELLDLLEDHSALQKKVSEATEILRSVDVPQTVEN